MMLSEQFGSLKVTDRSGPDLGARSYWSCVCTCGTETRVRGDHLRGGKTVSCGCQRVVRCHEVGKANLRHGHTVNQYSSLTYKVWRSMRDRCENAKHAAYRDYGGRGITVCDRWKTFDNFLADMGAKPAGLQIERRNNDAGYEPANCYWATRHEQANNRRSNVRVVVDGESLTIAQLADRRGVPRARLYYQYRHGSLVAATSARQEPIIDADASGEEE